MADLQGASSEEACEAFTRQVQILDRLTAEAYGFVGECLKKCDDPQQVSDCWSRFIVEDLNSGPRSLRYERSWEPTFG